MIDPLPLIVTRPEPGNAETLARARAMGLNAHGVPLFAARALAWTPPGPRDFDALLLTSAQAVRLAGPALAALKALPVYAVGAATAAAAEAAGCVVVMTGTGDAQSLLDAMTAQKNLNILWLCGCNRRTFDERSARIEALPCYAVDARDPSALWDQVIAAPAVILAHSARGAARIASLTDGARAHLSLVAIGAAAAAGAGDGWATVAVADRPDDSAMLARAAALCHKGQK